MKYVRVREHVPPPRPLASVIPCNVDKKLSLFVWADFEPHPLKSTRTLLTPPSVSKQTNTMNLENMTTMYQYPKLQM